MATIEKKNLNIDVNETLTNVERWISEYSVKVKGNYKLLNSETKSIKLTYSKNFDDLLTKMLKDTKECKLLNALKTDTNMKLKASYLADNNINALSLTKDKEGTPVIGYTDLRNSLVKDLGFLKTWSGRERVIKECREKVKVLEHAFPTIYDVLYNTQEHRDELFTDRNKSTAVAEVLARLHLDNHNIESNIINSPVREKFPNGNYRRIPPFFTYLSFQQQGAWEVERITKFVQRLLTNTHRLFEQAAGAQYIGKDRSKIGIDFKTKLIDTNIMYSLLEDIVCYFDYSLTSMADLLESLQDPKLKLEDFLIQLEARNKILIQNYLSVVRSITIVAQSILDMEHKGIIYNTVNGLRDSSRTLKNAGLLGMDFELSLISLNLQEHFKYISRYGTGNLEYFLNNAYSSFLKNLYSTQFRVACSPGKIASKLFNGHYTPVEVEEFTTLFKKHTVTEDSAYSIKIVDGALISHYYNEHMYSMPKASKKIRYIEAEGEVINALEGRIVAARGGVVNQEIVELGHGMDVENRGGGSLYQSCMKHARCYNQILTYSKNPKTIKLLIALDAHGKLAARAVLWYHDNGKIYLDRVYAMNEKARIDIFNWAENRKFINIYHGNGAYSKELQFMNDGVNGLLFTVDNAIDNIPYFDTARRVDNRGIIALGTYSNSDIAKANKKIQDIYKINTAITKPAPNIEAIAIKQLNALNIDVFRKKAVRKSYKLSQEYAFNLKTSVKRKNDIAPRYTWMNLGNSRKRVLSSEFDMILDFVNKNTNKPSCVPALPATLRVINKVQLEAWKAEKATKLITTMNFLGAANYRAA